MARNICWPLSDKWPAISQGGRIDAPPPRLVEVQEWIAEVCGVGFDHVELVQVFALKGWSITALFRIKKEKSVVFKANRLALYAHNETLYGLLRQCCPDAVPEPIGHRNDPSGFWSLFRAIEGKSVKEVGRPQLLLHMAELMAEIQVSFAGLPKEQIAPMPHFATDEMGKMLYMIIKRIRDYYSPRWKQAGGALLTRNGAEQLISIPDGFVRRLEASAAKVERWVIELVQGGWPATIHHTDLNPGNAIVAPDGKLKIIDWDQAVVGFPFDSIFWLESIAGEPQWLDRLTSKEKAGFSIKDAYLGRIPWNKRADRLRAWELIDRVGYILSVHESERLNDALQRTERTGGNIALLMANALSRWEAIEE